MSRTSNNQGLNKRLKLKSILHLKSDSEHGKSNSNIYQSSNNKKKRPMSASRFTLFKSNNTTVYKISENKKTLVVLNDFLEIYEIKTMNDMNENKLSIGKYITLGKNGKLLKPLFAKVRMERCENFMVKFYWHNTNNDIWEIVFQSNEICNNFCDQMIQKKDKEIASLDDLLSDDEDYESISEAETLAHLEAVDLLQLFKEAVSKMNHFKFENELPQRSSSIPSNLYRRFSLIDIEKPSEITHTNYRVSSENNSKYKRFSTLDYTTAGTGSYQQARIKSTSSVKKTILD
ncbi:hypothetical protein QEN19_000177 [Hanseniaspora menglaensis]